METSPDGGPEPTPVILDQTIVDAEKLKAKERQRRIRAQIRRTLRDEDINSTAAIQDRYYPIETITPREEYL